MTNFNINHINTVLKDKTIIIEASLDIDPNSTGYRSIEITDKKTKRILDFDYTIKENRIIITLQDWPMPNQEMLIKIQGILSVMGDELHASLKRKIYFNSEIVTVAHIQSPSDFQKIDNLIVSIKEVGRDSDLAGYSYIEIAKDNHFHDVIKETIVSTEETVELFDLAPGQYYMRARIQDGDQYGIWSNIITFIVKDSDELPTDDDSEEDLEPIIEEDLEITKSPSVGETPEKFIYEFSEELDPGQDLQIIVEKRRV